MILMNVLVMVSAQDFDCSGLKTERDIMAFVENVSLELGDTFVLPITDQNLTLNIINLENNSNLLCSLTFDLKEVSEFDDIIPKTYENKHAVNPPVHQWLVYQAKYLWSNPEILSNLPSTWSSDVDLLDNYEITYGARMEDDEIDPGLWQCLEHPFCNHFWGPDAGPDAGLFYVIQWVSNYRRAQTLWDTKVIPYYNSGDKAESYYWLGRVAHLLGDASVPAHMHLDVHLGSYDHDSYEVYMADTTENSNGNYRQWSASGNPTAEDTLYDLFYDMAEISDNYDSNDASGEYSSHYEGHNGACETQDGWWGCWDVSYAEAKIHGNALMVEDMRHIAGLYKLFWMETSDIGCPDPCCDNYDHFKLNNEQPMGFIDENICMNNNVVFANYYCTGASPEEFLQTSLIEDCGDNYCEGWDENYCKAENIYSNRTCHEKGCSSAECFDNRNLEEELVEECDNGCSGNQCINETISLQINSPSQNLSDERRTQINLTVSEKVDKITYTDLSDDRPREKTLCNRNCLGYGSDRKKTITFGDGTHNLVFRAIKDGVVVAEARADFLVDSKEPRIYKTEPKNRGISNGTLYVEFWEDNPVELVLKYGPGMESYSVDVNESCFIDRSRHKCTFDVNLSEYDGESIPYWVELRDIVGNEDISRTYNFNVDTTLPVVNNFSYELDGRRVTFIFNVTEGNFDEINYIDWNDANLREVRLCSRLRDGICEVRKTFRTGGHNLTLKVLDETGNSVELGINFSI